jgi:hypothetical protein
MTTSSFLIRTILVRAHRILNIFILEITERYFRIEDIDKWIAIILFLLAISPHIQRVRQRKYGVGVGVSNSETTIVRRWDSLLNQEKRRRTTWNK